MNPLQHLHAAGQSIWLDYIRRHLFTSGDLRRLIEQDAVTGMTSNPTLFEKAIVGSTDYDEALHALLAAHPDATAVEIYERLALEDIRLAADALRPVYDRTGGDDGFVSLEVPPALARDTQGTVAEARRLFAAVDRPNVMVKVPATPEGTPAIESLTAAGLNINITLIFSLTQYEAVAQAYLRGIAKAAEPARVRSVASVFVSRVDTKVDRALDALATPQAHALRGTIAIANAKAAYQRFKALFYGEAFRPLAARGARAQRLLWASTGAKDPAYRDVMYVEALIGPDTVDTIPPLTLDAFRDHGQVRPTLEEDVDTARRRLRELAHLGIDLDAVCEQIQREGLDAFAGSFNQLMQALDAKRAAKPGGRTDRQTFALGAFQPRVTERLDAWARDDVGGRLWAKDPTLWATPGTPEIADRLGWLSQDATVEHLDEVQRVARQAREEGVAHVVLLGMGGSSLAPGVFQHTFGNAPGWPVLTVLDSTHPAAVRAVRERIDPRRTWFLVSSKAGTTLEPLSFFRYFWAEVGRAGHAPGRQFLAVTDPGTPLEGLARDRGFRHVFAGQPDVGGRYSALTAFGLVPAALIGIDVARLLDRALTLAEACAFCVPEPSNPGLALGAALGELARAGRDKVTFVTSPRLDAFPAWLEQLIAESTGKNGQGIVPVAGEVLGEPAVYGDDRVFVLIDVEGHPVAGGVERLAAQGHPVVRIQLSDVFDLGQEMFRWEFATAAASVVLHLNPFDQPDVQVAKELARQAMSGSAAAADSPAAPAVAAECEADLQEAVGHWLAGARAHDYVGLQAYLAPTDTSTHLLETARTLIRDRLQLATTVGYGPRFLHSTGQLHKGGANNGLFLQLLDDAAPDLAVPETEYTFGQIIRAQALGDYQALVQRGRRVLRVRLGAQAERGLHALLAAVEHAFGVARRP